MTLTGAGEPFQATVLRTSGTLFEVLQTQVARGRALQRRDEQPDQPRVIVISHELWVERFSGDTNVLGRTLALSGTDFTVVGVLPPRFEIPVFDVLNESAALRSSVAAVVPLRLNFENIGWMGGFNYGVIARVKNRTSLESARGELDVLQQSVRAIARLETQDAPELRAEVLPLNEAIVGGMRLRLLLLLGAVVGVVMIACANLANLSLTRALDGSHEAAMRMALGATRAGLVRTVVAEQLVLAILGAALGVLAARS